MVARLGENLQREWDEDPFPDELWHALQTLKGDRDAGIETLTTLAERGSALAMMYLGHTLTKSNDGEVAGAEKWLTRSAEGGSIEGRFQLAGYHESQGNMSDALAELKALADQEYRPAMYFLGWKLYRGELGERNIPEALKYLRMAKAAGHLPASGLLSWIYRKEGFGVGGRIAAHWYCLAKIPALGWHLLRYPNSDRMRGFTMPSAT